jgi:hypothetical protein
MSLTIISAVSAMGQSGPSQVTAGPLTISWNTASSGDGSLALSAQNISVKQIRGIVFSVAFTSPSTGENLGKLVRTFVKPVENGQATYLEPGQTIRYQKPVPVPKDPTGAPGRPNVTVDSVVFGDGSSWGPAKLTESAKVLGMIEAMDRGMGSKK